MNDLLLVIDMQNVYLPDQPWACETVAHTKANILKLLEKHPKNQTIFTRYIAAEHPVGTWKTYNELNRKINEDPWMNELMDGIKEAAETYLIYDKSTYSSFQVPAIRQAARKADRIILTGVVSECCVLSTFFEGIDLGCKLIWLTDATSGLNPKLKPWKKLKPWMNPKLNPRKNLRQSLNPRQKLRLSQSLNPRLAGASFAGCGLCSGLRQGMCL